MDRRDFLKNVIVVSAAVGIAQVASAADFYSPTKVDQSLFQGINRAKDPTQKSPLEKSHAPVIRAPALVKAGEPFAVEVSVGEVLHPMGPAHWIEYIELGIGNEPAGRVDFQPKGYLKPTARFTVILPAEAGMTGKLTLMARQRCNLHGLWEGSLDIAVS
ncbi:MAG: class II SORL domain-containing protein [Deltaproteobacteria bacterium]|nr:class II SORL domain-containing protein [Deltaproteobacteria bacterium]